MPRLLFEKTGSAVWMSHLDLMRLFQRAFKRAGLPLTHTQGFNSRPSVSIALPLSVGTQSHCELLDFELTTDAVSDVQIRERLNKALVEGVHVLSVYGDGRKLRELALMSCKISLFYDHGIPERAKEGLSALFSSDSLIVEKKTKNGLQEQDIIPMIRRVCVYNVSEREIIIEAVVHCQNPTLNPVQLISAVERYMPAMMPDGYKCTRTELYDEQEQIFR